MATLLSKFSYQLKVYMPIVPGLRSPYDLVSVFSNGSSVTLVGGLVHFGRLIDKMRLFAAGLLPVDYHPSLGKGHDRVLCEFLEIDFETLRPHMLASPNAEDEELLEWAYQNGKRLRPIDLAIFNGFLSKRGWRDQSAANLPKWLAKSGLPLDAAQTNFDYIELDEGRTARGLSVF